MGSYMTKVAKMLGVEIGEVFKIDSKPHCLFRFTHKCLQVSVTPDFWLMGSDDYLRGFLNGSLSIHKLFWKPKKREIYYCPNIFGIDLYNVSVWDDSIVDKAEVAKMFGLELEEHFYITKKSYENTVYKFTKDGVAFYDNKLRTWYESVGALAGILTGETEVVKLPWKPRDNEHYFIPEITTPEMFGYLRWTNDHVDNHMYKHGLICRTKEEAIRKAELLMEYFKNNRIEGDENNG